MEALASELTKLIIEHLNLEDVEASEVDPDAPLFGDGLGLDSVDALEMVMLMETTYGATIESSESGRPLGPRQCTTEVRHAKAANVVE